MASKKKVEQITSDGGTSDSPAVEVAVTPPTGMPSVEEVVFALLRKEAYGSHPSYNKVIQAVIESDKQARGPAT